MAPGVRGGSGSGRGGCRQRTGTGVAAFVAHVTWNGTRADLGIAEGHLVLRQGALGLDPDEITEVMIVLTGGDDNAPCDLVLNEAQQAQGQGVQMISVCMGPECDERCMRQVASGWRFFYR